MISLLFSPLATRPDHPASREVAESWRARLREAGCVWELEGERVELDCPDDWVTPARLDWIAAHEGELRELALRWAGWRGDETEEEAEEDVNQ
jgi:hypothetical protein